MVVVEALPVLELLRQARIGEIGAAQIEETQIMAGTRASLKRSFRTPHPFPCSELETDSSILAEVRRANVA